MAENMQFLPRAALLSLEEMAYIANTFIELGVTKLRITGGEPLIRRNVLALFEQLDPHHQLKDFCLTTNGSHLAGMTEDLYRHRLHRINISIDSLKPGRFKQITRTGDLATVLAGIKKARQLPFRKIKLNSVIMRGKNDDEILDLVDYAIDNGLDISFIEEMPLGSISEHSRKEAFIASDDIHQRISQKHTLVTSTASSGGPARYWQVPNTQTRVGFISPHSNNFCSSCNRVRLTAEGQLLMCLGNEHSVDLRSLVRQYPSDSDRLKEAIIKSLNLKPEKHHFDLDSPPDIVRFMNSTGG